jgi:hypothetical protein
LHSSSAAAAAAAAASIDDVLEGAGADLIKQTPEIRTWLASLAPGKRLVIGAYAYLDGEAHVRASLAMVRRCTRTIVWSCLRGLSVVYESLQVVYEYYSQRTTTNGAACASSSFPDCVCVTWCYEPPYPADAIAADLLVTRGDGGGGGGGSATALAYLSSPGTAFPIPEAAYLAAGKRHEADKYKWWHAPLSLVTGGFRPNCRPATNRSEGKSPCYVHNGHLILQGPNYALAKTLQNWRTVVARAAGPEVGAVYKLNSVDLSLESEKLVSKFASHSNL